MPLPPFDPWCTAVSVAEVMRARRLSPAGLQALQARRFTDLVTHAAHASPLYAHWLRGADPARLALQDLPVVHKTQLMRFFEHWVADPALRLDELRCFIADPCRIAEPYLGRYTVWESSGSSGEPCIFVQDAGALAVYDALEALRRPSLPLQYLPGPWPWGARIAFVGATTGHFASVVALERLRRLNPMIGSSLRTISFLQPTASLVEELNRYAPTVLATYPSAALLLAEEQLAGRLHLVCAQVWTGGEMLTEGTRAFVQQAFGCPVVNSYGASEFLPVASECAQGRLHLNSDWVILEPVDAQGRAVPLGEPGDTTLLTNLANRVQPLIRYDLGDRVTIEAEPCACGSPFPVIDVEGRDDDSLCLGRGETAVRVLPLALSTALEEEAGLYDFELLQQGPCELQLSTGLEGEEATAALERAQRALSGCLARLGARGVHVHCCAGKRAPRGRSGKVKRVVALASPK
ncbi:phenylacetate--CoA ligase family protein [Caldimonas aquatica]|uniref:AMP-binding protein n=1 Tax=Caldimonas aquatica TaxID=376175 RepID=A0ABY6MP88_9BURK|nr:AMP-binding protein [Schlegelella aquatica]UZD53590.1 AMP-binding protein [Schlegelella aquatica]